MHGPEDQGLEAGEDQPAGLREVGLRERRLEGEIINYQLSINRLISK